MHLIWIIFEICTWCERFGFFVFFSKYYFQFIFGQCKHSQCSGKWYEIKLSSNCEFYCNVWCFFCCWFWRRNCEFCCRENRKESKKERNHFIHSVLKSTWKKREKKRTKKKRVSFKMNGNQEFLFFSLEITQFQCVFLVLFYSFHSCQTLCFS